VITFRTSKISDVLRIQLVRETECEPAKCTAPEEVAKLWPLTIGARDEYDRDKETFGVFILDAKNQVRHVDVVSVGLLDATLIHPREVYRKAIALGAVAIVAVHNHPSGDPTPSAEDLRITKQLIEAGKVVDIRLLDHVIVTEDPTKYISLRESSLADFI